MSIMLAQIIALKCRSTLCTLLLLVALYLSAGGSSPTSENFQSQSQVGIQQDGGTVRAVAILTFAGQGAPLYLEWSCTSIEASASLLDMMIFHENNAAIMKMDCGRNVIKVDLGKHGLSDLIANSIDTDEGGSNLKTEIRNRLRDVLPAIPYFLAEFKPMSGTIFKSYISSYSHWTYTDPDIIWGDIWTYLTVRDLQMFDIVTICKTMDANRLFLRGQFSLHKNTERLNEIWRSLTEFEPKAFAERLLSIVSNINNKVDFEETKKQYFVSAEGAYSYWVFQQQDLRIKIQGLMYSDRHECPMTYSNGFLDRCQHGNVCLSPQKCAENRRDRNDSLIVPLPEPILELVSPMMANCMMSWMDSKYNLCVRGHFGRINEATLILGKWYTNTEKASRRVRSYGLGMFHFRLWEDLDTIHSFIGKKIKGSTCFLMYKTSSYMYVHDSLDTETSKQTFSVEEELNIKKSILERQIKLNNLFLSKYK